MNNNTSSYKKLALLASRLTFCLLLFIASSVRAQEEEGPNFIMHHIQDAHDWHFATIGKCHVVIPLPIILYSADRGLEFFSSNRLLTADHQKTRYRGYLLNEQNKIVAIDKERSFYDISITKNVASMLISMILLVGIALAVARGYRHNRVLTVPRGFVAFLDLIICFIKNEVALPNIGKKHYEHFMPYLLTIFFFIWINNLMGLLPGSANVTGNISITMVLALFTFGITLLHGNRFYWGHIFNPPEIPKWLFPIMVPVEIIGVLVKPFSLMIRLFANITAGHIILLSIISLIFTIKSSYVGSIMVNLIFLQKKCYLCFLNTFFLAILLNNLLLSANISVSFGSIYSLIVYSSCIQR